MNKRTHVMIDIETLGTGQDAVILSIGGIGFNPYTGATFQPFYKRVKADSQPNRKIDASTVEWWFKQSSEARAALSDGERCDLGVALIALGAWIPVSFEVDTKVWANGVTFDIAILEHAYRQLGYKVPWHYANVCCMRTLKNLVPKELIDQVEKVGTAHNALDDAIFQAHYTGTALRWLKTSHEAE